MKKLKKPNSINPLFFTFFLFFKQSFGLDPRYEACVPKHCGDGRDIRYPFFIQGSQESYCGYPGFELHCSNGSSMLQISGNDFIVRDIKYQNGYVRLQNAAILTTHNESCLSNIRNITLDPLRFQIYNDSTLELVLLSNCSTDLPANLERYRIQSCQKDRELVMLANDANLRQGMELCSGGIVETPVELRGGEGRSVMVDGGNYAEVMERGFVLGWLAGDCGDCEMSGGRCGFNMTISGFVVFALMGPTR